MFRVLLWIVAACVALFWVLEIFVSYGVVSFSLIAACGVLFKER